MIPYKNFGGDSGIHAYELSEDCITIMFNDDSVYLYTYESTGKDNIEHMKALAVTGVGLNSFISRIIKKKYDSRLK